MGWSLRGDRFLLTGRRMGLAMDAAHLPRLHLKPAPIPARFAGPTGRYAAAPGRQIERNYAGGACSPIETAPSFLSFRAGVRRLGHRRCGGSDCSVCLAFGVHFVAFGETGMMAIHIREAWQRDTRSGRRPEVCAPAAEFSAAPSSVRVLLCRLPALPRRVRWPERRLKRSSQRSMWAGRSRSRSS